MSPIRPPFLRPQNERTSCYTRLFSGPCGFTQPPSLSRHPSWITSSSASVFLFRRRLNRDTDRFAILTHHVHVHDCETDLPDIGIGLAVYASYARPRVSTASCKFRRCCKPLICSSKERERERERERMQEQLPVSVMNAHVARESGIPRSTKGGNSSTFRESDYAIVISTHVGRHILYSSYRKVSPRRKIPLELRVASMTRSNHRGTSAL